MKVTFTIFLIWLCSHPFSCLSSLPLQHQGYEVDMEKRVCVGNMTILALVTNLYFTRLKVMSLKGKGFLFGHGHLVVKIVVVEWSLWWTWVHWCVAEYAGMVAFMKVSKSVPGVTPVKLRFIAIRCYFSLIWCIGCKIVSIATLRVFFLGVFPSQCNTCTRNNVWSSVKATGK